MRVAKKKTLSRKKDPTPLPCRVIHFPPHMLTIGAAATALAAATDCGRTDVPCLHVPPCSLAGAAFALTQVSNANGSQPSRQQATGSICWDEAGLRVHEVAHETSIFSPYTQCNEPVFVKSDVLEVFIAPVVNPTDNPRWYYELDASPSGVLWAGLSNNSAGNSSTCVAANDCTKSGTLPCSGRATFEHGLTVNVTNGSATYATELFVPWELFAPRFRVRDDEPWPHWRLNFYRYDYPDGPAGDYELTAWSPTHSPSFHVPARFGVAVLGKA